MSKRDYYDVLGVSRTADESELKSAYRKIAMKSHPIGTPATRPRKIGSRKRQKPMRFWPMPRSAASTTASGMPA